MSWYSEPKRMVKLTNIPVFLTVLWETQSQRRFIPMQDFINMSIQEGVKKFSEKRGKVVDMLAKARVVLLEEGNDPYFSLKVFTKNLISISDGPSEDPLKYLGFKKNFNCRLEESAIEKIQFYHVTTGIRLSVLYILMSYIYLLEEPIPEHYKTPMERDLKTFSSFLKQMRSRVGQYVKKEEKIEKSLESSKLDDIFPEM